MFIQFVLEPKTSIMGCLNSSATALAAVTFPLPNGPLHGWPLAILHSGFITVTTYWKEITTGPGLAAFFTSLESRLKDLSGNRIWPRDLLVNSRIYRV